MKTIKPQKLGVLTRTFENGDACYFAVSLFVFFPFAPPCPPLAEVDMWKFLPGEIGEEPLDMGMPKQRGEVLVTGAAYPAGGPRVACAPRVAIGIVNKTLQVAGDRFWKGGAPSEPVPFTTMPITWERAFGGAGYAQNPLGRGLAPVRTPHGEIHFLPNVEDPKHPVRRPGDRPPPAGFGAYDFTWPQRFSKVGTYDAAWLKERFPGFAKDLDWSMWNAAPEDQQIAGYFHGDEPFMVEYMHPEKARIEGRLPGVRTRAFITQKTDEGEAFREIQTRLDTVRLFPHAERGVLVFHGMVEVAEDDGADVLHLVIGCEDLGKEKAVEHYREVLAQRLDKEKGHLFVLRDRDLMPAPRGSADAPAEDVAEMQALVATEGLLQKNMRRRAEAEHEAAKKRMVALGLDPSQVPPLPPEEPPPDLDDLPGVIERANADADKLKAEAEKKKAEAEQQARAMCAAQGIDYDQMMRDGQAKAGGPPKLTAVEELTKLKALAKQAKAEGADVPPELDAMLSDPNLEERLRAQQAQMMEAYQKFAHHLPAAARLEGDQAARLRAEVAAGHRAGKSFAGCDFTGADLSGLYLVKADFKGALLEGVDFSGSELGGADFTDAVLARANLTKANLTAAKLAGANLGAAKLHEAELGGGVDLTGAVLAKADLTGARFHDATMERVDLMEATLAGADFTRVKAPEVNFIKTDLTGMKLGGADMTKCNFIESTVAGVDFTGAKLVSAVFLEAKGDRAVFRDADLTNLRVVKDSSFEGADFKGAKLENANLRGSRLAGSDFSGAHLDGAHLSECDLRGARFYRAVAKGAQLIRADLTGAVMTSVNLMEGSLQKAILHGADFRGANLFRVDFAKSHGDTKTNLKDANVKHVRTVRARKPPPRPRPSPAAPEAPRSPAVAPPRSPPAPEKVAQVPLAAPRDPIPVVMMQVPPPPPADLVPEGMRRFTDIHATQGVVPDAASRPALPFKPGEAPEPPPRAPVPEDLVPEGMRHFTDFRGTQGIQPEMLARPVLPFTIWETPPSPPQASAKEDLVPEGMRRFSDLHGTVGVLPDATLRPALPFAKEALPGTASAPPRAPAKEDLVPEGMRRFTDLHGTVGVLPDAAQRPALPFGSASGPAEEASVDALKRSIERYASLCIDIERAPERAGETLARYRITAEQKAAIDEHWRRAMSDAETRARWEEACRVYRAWLSKEGR